jgi:hypothetical protein
VFVACCALLLLACCALLFLSIFQQPASSYCSSGRVSQLFLEGQVSSTRNICLCRRNLYNIYILFSYLLLLAVDKLLVILMMMVMMVVCQKCAAVVGASRLIICHFLMLFIIECEYCRISN